MDENSTVYKQFILLLGKKNFYDPRQQIFFGDNLETRHNRRTKNFEHVFGWHRFFGNICCMFQHEKDGERAEKMEASCHTIEISTETPNQLN